MNLFIKFFSLTLLNFSLSSFAEQQTEQQRKSPHQVKQCVLNELFSGDASQTVADLKNKCKEFAEEKQLTAINKRVSRELISQSNPNVITPHKRNYILPFTYMSSPNNIPIINSQGLEEGEEILDNFEAKFQLSLKVSLFDNFSDKDQAVYFAFTMQSYWQVYNSDISAPFRETNYQPEIYWANILDKENTLWGDEMIVVVGAEHQSNGKSTALSRSWNRIYANIIWEQNGFVFSFKPWYRLPEDKKEEPNQPEGDDNPNIYKYMGYYELSGAYRYKAHEFGFMSRNNLSKNNRGALQLDWSFPLWGRLRGYVQYFNGYSESLIDYNASVERFGVGILLSDLL
ncbi:phospholipase [Pseudoalteromonas sp. NBT06-2]|uniref:phospholipase A n=1 Tax=Pseudoalteromonas sp. NBT06-2 TaxID=2025950 RepID=UPI000BA51DA5|nr:phospholipase A [Pseudoalteromonas sp. NBT06-2]PAJ74836.1 phospholipase [Pseudoalteromonas sp. NBT06-2]